MTARFALVAQLLISGLGGGTGVAAAEGSSPPPTYTALDVSGQVYVRDSWDTSWRLVTKGDELATGELIQVHPGSRLKLSTANDVHVTGMTADTMEFDIRAPMMLRIGPYSLRKVDTKNFSMPNPPAAKGVKPLKEDSLLALLPEAWTRYMAVVTDSMKSLFPDGRTLSAAEQAATLSAKAKRLEMLYPAENSIFFVDKRAMSTKTVWAPPDSRKHRYEVYIWRSDAQRGEPRLKTAESSAMVSVDKPGEYFIQVKTTDGAWQSPAVKVVFDYRWDRLAGASAQSQDKKPVTLRLKAPPPGMTISLPSTLTSLDFAWGSPWADGATSFTFKLLDSNDAPSRTVRSTQPQARIDMPRPGTYKWLVEAYRAGPDEATAPVLVASSGTRFLTIEEGKSALDVFEAALKEKQGSVVLVSDPVPEAGP